METINKGHIQDDILASGVTYASYRNHIDDLLSENKTTGDDHSEDMIAYTRMNVQRMKRIDKTAVIASELLAQLSHLKQPQTWLVISEAWCGDAAQNLPYLHQMAEINQAIQLKIVLRDENLELMDRFLTHGGRSIPKLIVVDSSSKEVLADWGPRPAAAQTLYNDLRAQQLPYAEFSTALHKWYADNKGHDLQAELLALLQKIR